MPKPWGATDLRPWSDFHPDAGPIGEIWFERAGRPAAPPALLLKLLFAREALSIQVHPDDAYAQSIGQPHGKTEAWYVLQATPDAAVAVGLTRPLSAGQLRAAIADGSIRDLVDWRPAAKGEAVYVPAGTIHAIGAGLVVAEIQQAGDTTFRLFDPGHHRELHADQAVAAAQAAPADRQAGVRRLSEARLLLVTSPYFVLEQIDFAPESAWELDAARETWFLVLEGHARIGRLEIWAGDAVFLEGERTAVTVGPGGLKGLLAYAGAEPCPDLLHDLDTRATGAPIALFHPTPLHPPGAAPATARSTEKLP